MAAVIVCHVAIDTSDDYLTRREAHRHAHIQRLTGLRAAGIVIAGGPAPDGKRAELFYRLQQASQLNNVVEEDPYWLAKAWTRYTPRTFKGFVEPWEAPPIVLDGSRRATIVEGPTTDEDMAQFAMIEMRGAGRIQFGGFLEGGATLALARTGDADEAVGWFRESGFWKDEALTARPFLYVL
jgi:uncharacterized protein YciI